MISKNTTYPFLFALLLACCPNINLAAQTIHDITYKLVGFDTAQYRDRPEDQKLILQFWRDLKYLDQQEEAQRKLNGQARFGFNGDKSEDQSLYKIDGGIQVSRGTYPTQFEFNTNFGITVNNNKINENVSNIFMSYDFNPPVGDSMWLEHYVFMGRFTDAYLGVEQRYELGFGTIFQFWSDSLTQKGKREMAKVGKSTFHPASKAMVLCADYCKKYNLSQLSQADYEVLVREQRRLRNTIKKLYTHSRAGLLVGVFLETEKVTFQDSLEVQGGGKQFFSQSFDPTQRIRWELRPFWDYRPSDMWRLKVRPYFKFPMPWNWYNTVSFDGQQSRRVDYRIDLETSLEVSLIEDGNSQTNLSVGLNYRLYYDNAPRRRYFNDLDINGAPVFLEANALHQLFRMMVNVRF